MKKVLDAKGVLAPGVTYVLGGLYQQQQQIAFRGLAEVFIAAMVGELILLLFLYERFWLAFIVIVTALLSSSACSSACGWWASISTSPRSWR